MYNDFLERLQDTENNDYKYMTDSLRKELHGFDPKYKHIDNNEFDVDGFNTYFGLD